MTSGSGLSSVGQAYLACGVARSSDTCSNRRSIRREVLEDLILDVMKRNLMRPELVGEFIRAFHEEVNRHRHALELGTEIKRKELATVERKHDGLINAIADGLRTPGLKGKLEDLEARKTSLEAELAEAPPPTPRLHPNLAELYRQKVASPREALIPTADNIDPL
jgi:site-specific DNA recombinase